MAFLGSCIYNSQPQWGKQKRKAVKPEDLIPSLKPAGKKGGRKAQTPDEQLFLARMIHARYMAAKKTPKGPNKG